MEKIGTAVRHYYGQYEEGEERPEAKPPQEAADISPDQIIETVEAETPVTQEDEPVVNAAGNSSERVEESSIEQLAEEQDEISGDGVDDSVTHALVDMTEAPMVSPEDAPQTAIDILAHSDPSIGAMERPESADHEIAGSGGDYEDDSAGSLKTEKPHNKT